MAPSVAALAMTIGYSIEALLGILVNVFILAVNFVDWLKTRKLASVDILLVAIGICNILSQCIQIVGNYLVMMWSKLLFSDSVCPVMLLLIVFATSFSFWLTAWLCAFYCVKITSINHPLFSWLKLRLSRMVPWLLLGSMGGSVALSLPAYWDFQRVSIGMTTDNKMSNNTAQAGICNWTFLYNMTSSIIGCCLPTLLIALSVGHILWSLCNHMWRMKRNMPDLSRPSLDTHVRAAGTMMGLLVISALYCLAQMSPFYVKGMLFWTLAGTVITSSFTLVQSSLLIMGNSKLRGALWRILSPCERQGA